MDARPLSVGFVGFGRIAAGFDRPEGPEINTHLKACLADGRFAVTMIADPDGERVARTLQLWGLDTPIVAAQTVLDAPLDVLCIASPDDWHAPHLERAARGSARLILCEKPWSGDRRAREATLAAIAARGAALVVNHTRRWIAPLSAWMTQARAGAFGRPLSARLVYGRGLRHNAVHGLDLIAGFLAPRVLDVHAWGEPIADYSAEDPTCSLLATMASDTHRFPLWIEGVDGRIQSAFGVDLRFADARVAVEDDDGLRAQLWRGAPTAALGFAPSLVRVDAWSDSPPGPMAALWTDIGDHLAQGRALRHAGSDCAAAYGLLDALTPRIPVMG